MSGVWIKGEEKEPVYTISEEDGELPSAHKIYMQSMNEYDAAMRLVPTWSFWTQMIKHSIKIKRMLESWREEKMLMDQARARAMLWEQAAKGNISAQKILYESKKEEAELRRVEREKQYKYATEKGKLEDAYKTITTLKAVK